MKTDLDIAADRMKSQMTTTARREFAVCLPVCDCGAELDGYESCYCADCESEIYAAE